MSAAVDRLTPVTALAHPPVATRRRKRLLRVAMILAIVALLIEFVLPGVRIAQGYDGPEPSIVYAGSATGYLFDCENITAIGGSPPQLVWPGQHFLAQLCWRNAAVHTAHTIVSFSVHSPYGLVSTSPSLPVSIGANASLTLNVTYSAPVWPGLYGYPTWSVTTD